MVQIWTSLYNSSFPKKAPRRTIDGVSAYSPIPHLLSHVILLHTSMWGRDSLFFLRLIRSLEVGVYLSFQGVPIISFLLDNNVLILGLVMEKSTLSLLLDAIFSLRSVGFAGAAQGYLLPGWPVSCEGHYVSQQSEQVEKRLPCLPEHFSFS